MIINCRSTPGSMIIHLSGQSLEADRIDDLNERAGVASCERYEFEGWTLDVPRRELTSPSGGICDLTTAEFELLAILVKRPGRVLSRDAIMDLLKGQDWSPLDRTIDGLVARLRRKLEPDNERPRLIKTVRGVGYAFGIEVRKL